MLKIQQIRNAANKIHYGKVTFLLDPWLQPKGEMGTLGELPGHPFSVPDPVKEQLPMPIYNLPEPVEQILQGVDAYIVTHVHPDHVDVAADGTVGKSLHKEIPVFVQNQEDQEIFRRSGFQDVRGLTPEGSECQGVTLTKTPARHGTVVPCGNSCGVVFQAPGEKTLYVTGDTVWFSGVQETLAKFQPQVVTVNACAAELVECGRLIMNDEDVACVRAAAPKAKIFVTHMDNVAHASLTRHTLRGRLATRGVSNYVMPEDGEIVTL